MTCKKDRYSQETLNSAVNFLNITSMLSFLVSITEKTISIRSIKDSAEYLCFDPLFRCYHMCFSVMFPNRQALPNVVIHWTYICSFRMQSWNVCWIVGKCKGLNMQEWKTLLLLLHWIPPQSRCRGHWGFLVHGREADTEAMGCILLPPVTSWKLTAHALRCQVLGTPLLGRNGKGRWATFLLLSVWHPVCAMWPMGHVREIGILLDGDSGIEVFQCL